MIFLTSYLAKRRLARLVRKEPERDKRGRFTKADRKLALINAQLMRSQMGLPADPRLAVR